MQDAAHRMNIDAARQTGGPAPAPTVLSAPDLPARFLEPEGLLWSRFAGVGGASLRWCHLAAPTPRINCILVGGFTEFAEKYFETMRDLSARGISVWCLDWRGQGGSARDPGPLAARAGVRNFDRDADDLASFAAATFSATTLPRLLIGHSMGAAVGLLALTKNPRLFDAAALSAPMLGIETGKFPRLLSRLMAGAATILGFDRHLVPGAKVWRFNSDLSPDTSPVSHCPERCQVQQSWFAVRPHLRVDGATYGWLHSAFGLTRRFRAPQLLENTTTPVLVGSAGKERFVKPKSHIRAAARLPNCRLVHFPEAKHELFMEADNVRARWLAEIDAFVATHIAPPGATT